MIIDAAAVCSVGLQRNEGRSMAPPPVPPQRLGPEIFTGRLRTVPLFPDRFRVPPQQPGYQDSHTRYEEIRNHFAKLAYAPGSTAEVVAVCVRLMVKTEGRVKPTPISVSSLELGESQISCTSRTYTKQRRMFPCTSASTISKFWH
jgi:hypothetical protein